MIFTICKIILRDGNVMAHSGALAKKALTIFGILNPNHTGSILNKINSPSESMIIVVDEPKTKSDESENDVDLILFNLGQANFTFTEFAIIWKRTNALRIICGIFEITKSSILTMGT